MLLYAQEMEQADKVQTLFVIPLVCCACMICSHSATHCLVQALSDGTTPSSVYGAEHLLRLFMKLPDLLPANQMSADDQLQLEMRLSNFLRFLQKNKGLYFLSLGQPDQMATS